MKLKILLIEDSEDDVFFFKRMLSNSGILADVVHAYDGEKGLHALKEYLPDCIFMDYHLPVGDGLSILKKIRSVGIDTPVVMLTGQKDEQTIVKLMHEGATDYLPKGSLTSESLRLSIENSRKLYQIKKEKELAEAALRVSEARLAEAQRIARIGNWEYDYKEQTLFLSDEARNIMECDLFSLPVLSDFAKKIEPQDLNLIKRHIEDMIDHPSWETNTRFISLDGSIKYLNIKCQALLNEEHSIEKVRGTVQDITVLKNALTATKKATVKSRATTIVLGIAIALFLISEAVLDPFIDSITASLMVSLSFKGSIALILKPVELFLERIMLGRLFFT